MNGWSVVLLVADLGGVAVATVNALRPAPADDAERTGTDWARFGVTIVDHEAVEGRAFPDRPTLSEADVAGGVAASVER